jgi:hypothetical protein
MTREALVQTTDPLIDEILKLPGTVHLSGAQVRHRHMVKLPDDDVSWDFYDSSYALRSGLQVTVREVPAELCRAVFPLRLRYTVRR